MGVWVFGEDAGGDESIGDEAGDEGNDGGKDEDDEGPLDADKGDEDEGEGEGVPGAGDEEREDLAERGAAFVEFHADHEDAVVAEVEEESGSGGAEESGDGAAFAEDGGDEFAGDGGKKGEGGDADEQAPPHFVHELEDAVGE